MFNLEGKVLINPRLRLGKTFILIFADGTEIGFIITRDAEVASSISSGISQEAGSRIDEGRGRSSSMGSNGDNTSPRDELVYKGRKGKGMIHEKTLVAMSPPISRSISSLRVDEPSSSTCAEIDTLSLENHLILCYLGRNIFPKTLLFFIEVYPLSHSQPLRKLNPSIPIVILSSKSPSQSDRLVLDQFNLIFVNGNPL